MNKEDYFEYYIQGSDHYLIPKDVFDELYNEMQNWKEDCLMFEKTLKELNKTLENARRLAKGFCDLKSYDIFNQLLDFLERNVKGEKNE